MSATLIQRRGRIRTRTPRWVRPGTYCRFYVRLRDASTWAILLDSGRPVSAVAVTPKDMDFSPAQIDFAARGIDARGWDLRGFAQTGGTEWLRFGPAAPKPLQPMNSSLSLRRRELR